jgi:hypothetical protein
MKNIKQFIQDLAYTEILIKCKVKGCLNLFEPSLDEPATDPVDDWAEKMAQRAMQTGWSADTSGRVLCPSHRHLADAPFSTKD